VALQADASAEAARIFARAIRCFMAWCSLVIERWSGHYVGTATLALESTDDF